MTMDSIKLAHKLNTAHWIGFGSQAEYGAKNKEITEYEICNPTTLYGKVKKISCEIAQELCEYYKENDDSNNPFDNDETIKYALEHIGNLTARKINETFSIIFEMALLEGKDQITQSFIDSIKDEIIAWEE